MYQSRKAQNFNGLKLKTHTLDEHGQQEGANPKIPQAEDRRHREQSQTPGHERDEIVYPMQAYPNRRVGEEERCRIVIYIP